MKTNKIKKFVIDTNVILHDFNCLYSFDEHDIHIPIVVLEELDHFKKGSEQINYNARQFVRSLDLIADNSLFADGVSLGEAKGKLFIETNMIFPKDVSNVYHENIADHRILAATYNIATNNPDVLVVLVSKDINLRMKALALGLNAEDYINDKVTDKDVYDKNHEIFENIEPELIDKIYAEKSIDIEEIDFASDLLPNDCFVMKSIRSSVLVRYNAYENSINQVVKSRCFGIEARNAEQAFALDVLKDKNISLVALTGRSGTGKTLMALAAALCQHDDYKQILLSRPIVALSNRDLGYLPGDEKSKISPYMQPLFDNLNVIKNSLSYQGKEIAKLDELQSDNRLIIEALAYIRGRSLNETFFIIDEAQNLTPHEVKTIITRAGEGTKIVFTGDIYQIDSPYLDMHSNGLVYMIDRMRGQDLFAHINLVKGERSYLSELASELL